MSQSKPNSTHLKNNLDAVNSNDYWLFRKNNGTTHAEFVAAEIAKKFAGKDMPNAEGVMNVILATYDTDKNAKAQYGSTERQTLQYLGQLTDKGFNRLVNKIRENIAKANALK